MVISASAAMAISDDIRVDSELAGHKQTRCELIAKSKWFLPTFYMFTCFYLVWLGIDVDMNSAETLFDSDPVFIAVELLFTVFFTFNIVVRVCAVKFLRFLTGVRNLFEFVLWVLLILKYSNFAFFSGWQLLRVFSLVLIAASAVPELKIMLIGLVKASRSMFYVLLSLLLDTYVFAVLFRKLADGTDVGRHYFETVSDAMYTLMLHGIFFQGMGDLIEKFEEPLNKIFFFLYIFTTLVFLVLLFGVMMKIVDDEAVLNSIEQSEIDSAQSLGSVEQRENDSAGLDNEHMTTGG